MPEQSAHHSGSSRRDGNFGTITRRLGYLTGLLAASSSQFELVSLAQAIEDWPCVFVVDDSHIVEREEFASSDCRGAYQRFHEGVELSIHE